jgi:hypothetical protein
MIWLLWALPEWASAGRWSFSTGLESAVNYMGKSSNYPEKSGY